MVSLRSLRAILKKGKLKIQIAWIEMLYSLFGVRITELDCGRPGESSSPCEGNQSTNPALEKRQGRGTRVGLTEGGCIMPS